MLSVVNNVHVYCGLTIIIVYTVKPLSSYHGQYIVVVPNENKIYIKIGANDPRPFPCVRKKETEQGAVCVIFLSRMQLMYIQI